MSDKLSKEFVCLKAKLTESISRLEREFNEKYSDHDPSQKELSGLKEKVRSSFDDVQNEYMNRMKHYYTNWNSGFTKNGKEKTFDFFFDRKSTIARADLEHMIDEFLCTGVSQSLDELYVKIQNGTMRHIGHSGPKDKEGLHCFPSSKDRCAVKTKVVDQKATEEKIKKWETGGKKGRKPGNVQKEVYRCKRRLPQKVYDQPTIYQDPFKKEITQFCSDRNDGLINGGCKFAILLNLNNVDDKLIVEEWLIKPPKVKWVSREKGAQITLAKMKGGQLPEEYTVKYLTKGVPARGAKGDVILACVETLEPENAVNMGVFTKMNNFVNRKGPIPIFNVVHNNMKLPLVLKNFNLKECSVLGLSQVKKANPSEENDLNDADYITLGLIDKFNGRLDRVVKCGKLVREADFKREMALKEFCDRYEAKFIKDPETNDEILYLSVRRNQYADVHNGIRLIPHLSTARANPKAKNYWLYCRHLCLWLIPCTTLNELLPNPELEDKDLENYWIDQFNRFVENNASIVPLWVKRQYWKYHHGDSSSDEDEDNDQGNGVQNRDRHEGEQEVELSNSDDDSLDGDPRAKRCDNAFYQEIGDQCHFRNQCDAEEENSDMANLINISNPQNFDFSEFAKGKVLPPTSVILGRLNSLKDKKAISNGTIDVVLNDSQRAARDIIKRYAQGWVQARFGGENYPKALRFFLMGSPGAGKSLTTTVTTQDLRLVIGEDFDDVVKQATPTGCASLTCLLALLQFINFLAYT